MDHRDSFDLPQLVEVMTSTDEVGTWAVTTLTAFAAVILFRFLLQNWVRELWPRRFFWAVNLVLLPLTVYALTHFIGVAFENASNAKLASWLDRGRDAALALVVAMLIVEGLDVIIWKGFARRIFGQATPGILIGVSAFIIYLATTYIVATTIFDIPVTGALVSSGIVLGIIGLSIQSTLADIFSGVFISLERPFRIGDWIVTEDGRLGKVFEIDWRATRLLSFNETVFVVPNSKIANSIIENRSAPTALYGHYFYVHMAPEAPTGLVRRVLLEAVLSSPYVQSSPPPNVYLSKANKRPYKYLVYVYFENYEASWRGNADVMARIHDYLKRVGLTVAGEASDVQYRRLPESPSEEPSIQQLLAEIDLFQTCSIEELEILSQDVRTNRYRPNDIVISEGDEGDSLLVITNGLVHVTRKKPRGRHQSVTRLGIGQCIGEMSMLTGSLRSATVQAVTDCEVVEIPKESINLLIEKRPDLVDELARTMSERRAADELIAEHNPESSRRLSLQDIAERFGNRIRSFFRD
ncbi:MAG: small-conductance mechanosensitive channel/CRP-like cAMP-binding protein [Planctomycetota bacterium]|jgi:small-conductance mechanosensitive channel/CRP-like cAMP-binding protein